MTAWRWCALCVTAVVASVAPASYLAGQAPVAAARAYRERHEAELLSELREFAELHQQFGLVALTIGAHRRQGGLSCEMRSGADAHHQCHDAQRSPPQRGHRARAPPRVRAKKAAAASYAATQSACVRKS